MRGDGDGWVVCDLGHRHWGRHGSAGLLLRAVGDDHVVRVLLQHRAQWSHEGGTWGVPGGARDSEEDAPTAALREAAEETGLDPALVGVRELAVADHGRWSYTTVLADTPRPLPVQPLAESEAVRWVDQAAMPLPLHPGFAAALPDLGARPLDLVVDAANVVGSRPDGWWRDRAGAARRLLAQLSGLRARLAHLPTPPTGAGGGERIVVRRVVAVLEGAARVAADGAGAGWVEVHSARGAGDDAIVDATRRLVLATGSGRVAVVTADRGLRARLPTEAVAVGPGWLHDLTDAVG